MSYGKEEIMTEKKKTLLICGLLLAVCLLVLLISFAAVIRLTKPVEYKR